MDLGGELNQVEGRTDVEKLGEAAQNQAVILKLDNVLCILKTISLTIS
jgi:hypothetical protein